MVALSATSAGGRTAAVGTVVEPKADPNAVKASRTGLRGVSKKDHTPAPKALISGIGLAQFPMPLANTEANRPTSTLCVNVIGNAMNQIAACATVRTTSRVRFLISVGSVVTAAVAIWTRLGAVLETSPSVVATASVGSCRSEISAAKCTEITPVGTIVGGVRAGSVTTELSAMAAVTVAASAGPGRGIRRFRKCSPHRLWNRLTGTPRLGH